MQNKRDAFRTEFKINLLLVQTYYLRFKITTSTLRNVTKNGGGVGGGGGGTSYRIHHIAIHANTLFQV